MSDPLRSGAIFRYKAAGVPSSGQKTAEVGNASSATPGTSLPSASTSHMKAPPPTPATMASPNTPYSGIVGGRVSGDLSSGKNSLLKQRFDLIYRATPLPPTIDVQSFRPPTAPQSNPSVIQSPAMFMPPPPPPNTMMASRRPYGDVRSAGSFPAPSYQSSPYQQHSTNLIPPHSYTPPAQAHYSSFPQPNFSQAAYYQPDPNLSYHGQPGSASKPDYRNPYFTQEPQLADRYPEQEMDVQYDMAPEQPDSTPESVTEDDYPTDEDMQKAAQPVVVTHSAKNKLGSPHVDNIRRSSKVASPEKSVKKVAASPAAPSSSSAKKSVEVSSPTAPMQAQSNNVDNKPVVARRGVGRGGTMDSLLVIMGISQPPKRVEPPKIVVPPPVAKPLSVSVPNIAPAVATTGVEQPEAKPSKRILAEPVVVQTLKQSITNKHVFNEEVAPPKPIAPTFTNNEPQVKSAPTTEVKIKKKPVMVDKTPNAEAKPQSPVVPATTRSGRVPKVLQRLIEEIDMKADFDDDEMIEAYSTSNQAEVPVEAAPNKAPAKKPNGATAKVVKSSVANKPNTTAAISKKPNIAHVSKSLLDLLGEDDDKNGKKVAKDWQPNEVVALYAVHSQTPVTLSNFWDEISNQLKAKGIFRSKEDCEQRWYTSLFDAQKRREKVMQRKKMNQVNSTMEKLQEINDQESHKSLAASKAGLKAGNKEESNGDVKVGAENEAEPLAKKRRLMKQDMKIMAEQSSKAVKEDDLFDAYNMKGDGSGLSILDIPIPDIPSPMVSEDRQQDDDDEPGRNIALFKSNHIHKIHNRIKPQLISTLPPSNASLKAKYSHDTNAGVRNKQSINVLERRIEKAIKTVRQEHRRKRDGDDYNSESLGDDDTEDDEEDEELYENL